MNTAIRILYQRRMRRNEQFPLVTINRQLKEIETPTKDDGFDVLVVKKTMSNQETPNLLAIDL